MDRRHSKVAGHEVITSTPLLDHGQGEGSTMIHSTKLDRENNSDGTQLLLGKPGRRARTSLNDLLTVLVLSACFAFGVATVANANLATRFGQTNQLVILGFVLSIMGLLTFKQAQVLMLVLEAKFGPSTLQNYNAILRDEKFGLHTSIYVRFCLILLFAMPLALSALYKQFVGGTTIISVPPEQVIHFGPSSPPGLFAASGRHYFLNATAGLFPNGGDILRQDPIFNNSYGYNMYIVNETVTAMLDIPFHSNVSEIQLGLIHGKSLTISAQVGATFSRLNSTPTSPERQDPHYWPRIKDRFGDRSYISRGLGDGGHFDMWNSMVDTTLVFMSLYVDTYNETFTDNAIGFNNYRGTANATWRITSGSVQLISADNFATNFSPYQQYPEVIGNEESGCLLENATTKAMQKVLYCGWESLGLDYDTVYPEYVIGLRNATGWDPSPLSVWVAITASMMWSVIAALVESYGIPGPQWQYLITTPEYEMWATFPTLRASWGLYLVLAVQPILFFAVLLARTLIYPSVVSENFGIVALLAGVDRQSLDTLSGASFSGKVRKPVFVHITERSGLDTNSTQAKVPTIEYKLCSKDDVCQYCSKTASLKGRYESPIS